MGFKISVVQMVEVAKKFIPHKFLLSCSEFDVLCPASSYSGQSLAWREWCCFTRLDLPRVVAVEDGGGVALQAEVVVEEGGAQEGQVLELVQSHGLLHELPGLWENRRQLFLAYLDVGIMQFVPVPWGKTQR